ncbi:MAG TPA: HD domain-containing protein [Candidatus Bathyarchaeia archaeon]|nr:HD domain-containing protein [Candidatus Bathyarchaeia archaeon]
MTQKSGGFIKDPIHGYVRISQTERSVIDTEPVQRLKRIRQLAGSEFVYPAANHTRFEHVIGAMHLAGSLAEALPIDLPRQLQEQLRLAALLHDVGHGPFSHVFEPLLTKYLGKNHEDFVPWLVNETEISERLEAAGLNARTLGKLAVGNLANRTYPYLDQIVSSDVDVDKMDYVVRDSFHTGAGYGSIDVHRLLYAMDIIDKTLSIDGSAVATLESFLLARFESFRTIYFHKASRAVQIMMVKALEAARDELHLLDFDEPEDFLRLDDYKVWTALKECKKSRKIMQDLEARRLLKCAYERTLFSRKELVTDRVSNEHIRGEIEQQIAKKARISPEDVIIDAPSLPSVPYHNTVDLSSMDVPVFMRAPNGKKQIVPLTDVSKIAGVLHTFMNLVRVYTRESYRSRVESAASQILGTTATSKRID